MRMERKKTFAQAGGGIPHVASLLMRFLDNWLCRFRRTCLQCPLVSKSILCVVAGEEAEHTSDQHPIDVIKVHLELCNCRHFSVHFSNTSQANANAMSQTPEVLSVSSKGCWQNTVKHSCFYYAYHAISTKQP